MISLQPMAPLWWLQNPVLTQFHRKWDSASALSSAERSLRVMSKQSPLRRAPLPGTGAEAPDPCVHAVQTRPVWLAFLASSHQPHTILCPHSTHTVSWSFHKVSWFLTLLSPLRPLHFCMCCSPSYEAPLPTFPPRDHLSPPLHTPAPPLPAPSHPSLVTPSLCVSTWTHLYPAAPLLVTLLWGCL